MYAGWFVACGAVQELVLGAACVPVIMTENITLMLGNKEAWVVLER